MLRTPLRRALIGTVVTAMLLPAIALITTSTAGAATGAGPGVTNLALANVGKVSCATNTLGARGFDTSCTGNGGAPEPWSADFVAWDWANEGINTAGLTNSAGGATPGTFWKYGASTATLITSPDYAPQLGDAVVYDSPADYVAIVTAINGDGSIQTTNGDWGGQAPGTSSVVNVAIPSGQTAVGSTPAPMAGKVVAGYLTPRLAAGASTKLSPFGATTWTPPGGSTPRVDIFAADANGVLWDYVQTPGNLNPLGTAIQAESGWTHYRPVGIADMDHNGYPDVVVIDTNNNLMMVFTNSAAGLSTTPTQFRTGWLPVFSPIGITDYNHTGVLGIITIDRTNNDLWFYPGDMTGGITAPRIQIGAGWTNAFQPVGVADITGDGHSDILTCRTDENTMVVYPGDGVGTKTASSWMGSCNNKTVFGLTDYNGDGRPDLITRNDTTGQVSVIPASLNNVSTVVATGSAATKALAPFGSATFTPPGSLTPEVDIYAADTSGNLWKYTEMPQATPASLAAPVEAATGWTHYRPVGVADMDHNGYPDVVAIDTNNNLMMVFTDSATGLSATPTQFRIGWLSNFIPIGITDYNHTGVLGIITIDRSTGLLWFYPGDMTGGITAPRVQIGAGWTAAYAPVGVADFSGDGHADVLSCRGDINSLQVSPGDGTGGTGPPTELANGCGSETFLGVTDYTGDARPDVIARDNATGNILVAANDGTGGWLNNNTTIIANNW